VSEEPLYLEILEGSLGRPLRWRSRRNHGAF